jgi:hypothetical protein
MADPTTYQRCILKFFSPFARKDALQEWQLKFNLSGSTIDNFSDAETTALDLAAPVIALASSNSYLGGWLWYGTGSSTNDYNTDYDSADHPCTGSAYTTIGDGEIQQLEVCALIHAPVGVSSKGRQTYLMKHVHDVRGSNEAVGQLLGNTVDLTPWTDGAGPASLVPVSPTTGDAPSGWSVHQALYTRQLRKGSAPPG